jgi:hypothetical protein
MVEICVLCAALTTVLAPPEGAMVSIHADGRIVTTWAPPRKPIFYVFTGLADEYKPEEVKVYRTDGAKVDPKDLPKLLKTNRFVLKSVNIFPLAKYLRDVDKDTLIFVVPYRQRLNF